MSDTSCSRLARTGVLAAALLLSCLAMAPAVSAALPQVAGDRSRPAGSPSPRRGRSEPRAAGPRAGRVSGHQRPDAAHGRPRRVRPRPGVRARDLRAAQEPAGAPLDAGDLGADLRDVQDVSDHAGQVHPAARALHRHDHGVLLRGPAGLRPDEGRDHPPVQPHRHRRELRRRVVRDPREHVRELARRVRRPEGTAVPDLRDSVERRHEHRDAAHQRRALHDAVHPSLHPRRLRGRLFHRVRDRRIARRLGAPHRRRHLHQDRRHRRRPDEDRLQHQGRRRAQSRGHRGLHGGQRRGLGRPERRRVRDLRRHRRGADLVHPRRRREPDGPGAAARVDLRHARDGGHRERRVVSAERGLGQEPLRGRRDDELRDAADDAGVADVDRVGRPDLHRVVFPHPRPG